MLLASLAGELISTKFIPTEGNCFTPHPSNKLWLLKSKGEIQNTVVVEFYLKKFFFFSFYLISKRPLSNVSKVLLSNPFKSQTGSKNIFLQNVFLKNIGSLGHFGHQRSQQMIWKCAMPLGQTATNTQKCSVICLPFNNLFSYS